MSKKTRGHRSDRRSLKRIGICGGLTAVSGGLFVLGMIRNGNGAVTRYEVLIATDQAGGDVDSAINDLRTYIYSHMNTEIGGPNGIYPPIQLKGTYERLVQAESDRVKQANDDLYNEAQAYCEANGNQGFSGRNRLDCINGYIDTNGAKPREIEDSLYKYDFVAPRWSPDLAGFSIVACVLFGLLTFFSLLSYLRTRHFVRMAN
jgi:hypothetical protein